MDVTQPEGHVVESVFRIERDRHPDDPSSLHKELMIVRALQATSVRSPRFTAATMSWAVRCSSDCQAGPICFGMIGGWTEIFFRPKELGPSAAAPSAMVATGAVYVATAARVDRRAALMGAPYVAWLGFATLLAEQIWEWNRSPAPAQTT